MSVEIQPLTIYVGLAIVGIFSGIGNAIGQYVFTEYLKKHLFDRLRKKKLEG